MLLWFFHVPMICDSLSPVERKFVDWCLKQNAQLGNVIFPMSFGGERGVGTGLFGCLLCAHATPPCVALSRMIPVGKHRDEQKFFVLIPELLYTLLNFFV